MSKLVTLIIPTLNRPDFLLRTLSYYAASGFAGKILIGDSSGPAHRDRVKAFLRDAPRTLHATHLECPELDDRKTLLKLSALVATPYVAYIGDDDFLLPHGIGKCVELLESRPELVAAHGRSWLFTVDANGVHGRLALGSDYPLSAPAAESPLARLEQLLSRYRATLFSVHRTPAWRAIWRDADQIGDRALGAEILPCCRSAILGKAVRLEAPYLLRQVHLRRYSLPARAQWMQAPGWQADFARACDVLAADVNRASGSGETTSAADIAELFRRTYLAPGVPGNATGISRPVKTLIPSLRQLVRRSAFVDSKVRNIVSRWRMARLKAMTQRFPGARGELDLLVASVAGTAPR